MTAEFICYNWMPLVADHIMDQPEDYYRNHGVSRLHNTNQINPFLIKERDLIFVKTDYIVSGLFNKTIIPYLVEDFSLITGISCLQLDRDARTYFDEILNHPNLHKIFCVHPPNIVHKKIVPIPIGFEEKERPSGDQGILSKLYNNRKNFSEKKNKILLPWHNLKTNDRRSQLINFLRELPFVDYQEQKLSFTDYLRTINEYKFVIGLEGGGPDIHRNYEALLVNTVPININNSIRNLFEFHSLPGIFVKDWKEITSDHFGELLKHNYDFSKVGSFLKTEHHISLIRSLK